MRAKLYTVGDLAKACGVPKHRILYVLKSRKIIARYRLANYRVYDASDLERVRERIAKLDARRRWARMLKSTVCAGAGI